MYIHVHIHVRARLPAEQAVVTWRYIDLLCMSARAITPPSAGKAATCMYGLDSAYMYVGVCPDSPDGASYTVGELVGGQHPQPEHRRRRFPRTGGNNVV